MLPFHPPLPTAWNLPFQPDAGSQTSILISESDEGFSVAALGSCEEALDYLHGSPRPELIVLDLMMPGMGVGSFATSRSKT